MLLLALFPWLRTERGIEAAHQAAEQHVIDLFGPQVSVFGPELPRGVDTVATSFVHGELQDYMFVTGDPWVHDALRRLNGPYVRPRDRVAPCPFRPVNARRTA